MVKRVDPGLYPRKHQGRNGVLQGINDPFFSLIIRSFYDDTMRELFFKIEPQTRKVDFCEPNCHPCS